MYNSIDDQINKIAALKDGWLDGEGKQISICVASVAREVGRLEIWYRIDDSAAFPTQVGGIIIEGNNDGWLISVEIDPKGKCEVSAFKPKNEFPPFTKTCDNSDEVCAYLKEILSL
jgi:hypothetical protein